MSSVSHSEVDSYLLCRRKWYYGYGLSLQRINESASLATGSAGHAVLEAFYNAILAAGNTRKAQAAAFDAALIAATEKYDAIVDEGFEENDDRRAPLAFVLFDPEVGYFAQEPFVRNGYLIQAVEASFNLEYEEGETYPFVIDLIVKSPDMKTIVVDHKFVWDFYKPADSDIQPQVPKYIGALRALNYKVDEGMYNMVRTRKIKAPTREQMHDMLVIRPTSARVVRTFEEQVAVARSLVELKAKPIEEQERLAFRVANKMVCQSCSFRTLCEEELRGGNTNLVLRSEYKVRERRAFVEVSADADE